MTSRRLFFPVLLALLSAIAALPADPSVPSSGTGPSAVAEFLVVFVIVLLAAKAGGEIFERLGQPAVLGELVFGILLGNLHLVGVRAAAGLAENSYLELAAELGVILLLFEVGLESDLASLLAVGRSAVAVATFGVIAPVLLGYGVTAALLPGSPWYVDLFAGATLAATSVGITARVLKDLGKTASGEGRIILGAAVVDDVLGLVLLAIVTGLTVSVAGGGHSGLSAGPILWIVAKAVLFLVVAVAGGRWIAGLILSTGARARVAGMAIVLSVCFCFAMAAAAEAVGLAPIVGAFAAGLVLNESHFAGYSRMCARDFREIVRPLTMLFTPVFFAHMGMRVDLGSFTSGRVLLLAAALTAAAIAGKQICALGVFEKGVNRLAVGLGMIPRGEVGLIFAGIGATLIVGGRPVFSPGVFSAMVLMVMVTTLVTPPLLKLVFVRQDAAEPDPVRKSPGGEAKDG